ncbi:hypothetical protein [uncultured Paraglaciecola sp.]|uniref:hypothetical protein n=1 Tax=uncultured Paraglaciecola sp. TaxID=1765024 RepID=UPI0030DD2E21|tara:strand:+ start:1003 stop:1206 length:204 start_codon:yes stop_codon:yes gene_type:complete
MAKSLADFLEELDSNAELKEAYLKDPVATAKTYGLTDEDVNVIKNKDWDTVKKLFESSGKGSKVHTY